MSEFKDQPQNELPAQQRLENLQNNLGFSETPSMRDTHELILNRYRKGELPAELSVPGSSPNPLNELFAQYHTEGMEIVDRIAPKRQAGEDDETFERNNQRYMKTQAGLNLALARILLEAGRIHEAKEVLEGDEGLIFALRQEGFEEVAQELEDINRQF